MRAILEYNIEDKWEAEAHLRAVMAQELTGYLWDIDVILNRDANDTDKIKHIREIMQEIDFTRIYT